MTLAIIDLGTNSVRFDVYDVFDEKTARLLYREKVMVRLGDGVYTTGRLNEAAIERTLEELKRFEKTAHELEVSRIIAVGTSALRDARDGLAFAERVRSETGIPLRIISGDEEARLIALGVLSYEEPPRGFFALVDIGGGSTEVSLCRGSGVVSGVSFRLGTARLTQLFLKTAPPVRERADAPHPIELLRNHIRETLEAEPICRIWPKARLIIGSSGTIRALVKLKKSLGKKAGKNINRDTLRKLVNTMSEMTTDELRAMPGMNRRRVDMILAGGILLEELMDFLRAKKVVITDYSLRDGLIENELRSGAAQEMLANRTGTKGAATSVSVKNRLALCDELFQRLKPVHRLRNHWLGYARAAIVAETLAPLTPLRTRHPGARKWARETSAQFGWFESWERRFITRLLLRHTRVGDPRIPFSAPERTRALVTLSTILTLCDQLQARMGKGRRVTQRIGAHSTLSQQTKRRTVPQLRVLGGRTGSSRG